MSHSVTVCAMSVAVVANVFIPFANAATTVPEEAVAAWYKLRSKYTFIEFRYKQENISLRGDAEERRQPVFATVRQNGCWFVKEDSSSDYWPLRVVGQNSRYVFGISSSDEREYRIDEVIPRSPAVSHPELDALESTTFTLLSIGGMPIERLLDAEVFSITRVVTTDEENGADYVHIEFSRIADVISESSEITDWVVKGWVIVDPHASWCVVEYEREQYGGIVLSGRNSYTMMDGIPVISSYRSIARWPDNRLVSKALLDYEHVTFTTLPEEVFTLSAYGLPEVIVEPRPLRRVVGLVLGVAVLLIILGIILLRRNRIRRVGY